MSDCCDPVFLREPIIVDLLAMGNEILIIPIEEWNDSARTVPYDFSGYTGRAALRFPEDPFTITPFTTVTIVGNLVTATLDKSVVETLAVNVPFIFDVSVDNGIVDSFCLATGTITFRQGASS